jgi:hypothetical protein
MESFSWFRTGYSNRLTLTRWWTSGSSKGQEINRIVDISFSWRTLLWVNQQACITSIEVLRYSLCSYTYMCKWCHLICSSSALLELKITRFSRLSQRWLWRAVSSGIYLKITRRFGGTYRLHLQGRRISRARNQRQSTWQAQQSASRNFELYRKRGRKIRQQVSYLWIARRTDETATEYPLFVFERSCVLQTLRVQNNMKKSRYAVPPGRQF